MASTSTREPQLNPIHTKTLVNKIWLLLTNTIGNMERHKGYYQQLEENLNDHMLSSKRIIINDIRRTYASVITQDTKDRMFRILYNYAKRNMEIGYCQGMNFMCYHFLDTGYSEEETFWILAYIFEQLLPKNYYINMVPIIADIKMLKNMLNQKHADLVRHIQELNVDLNFLLIPWFVMSFTNLQNDGVG